MRTNPQALAKILGQGSNVSSRRTLNAHLQIKSAVAVVLQQLAAWLAGQIDRFKIVNANLRRLPLDLCATPRQFVKFTASLFLRRIHWRDLIDLAAQTLKRRFNLFPAPALAGIDRANCSNLLAVVNGLTGDISRIGGVTQP